MIYSSKQNALIKKIASLKDKKGRREHGLYIVEGVKMVSEAIKYGQDIDCIVISERCDFVAPGSVETITVTEQVFSYLTGEVTPQGVLAVIKIPENSLTTPSGNAIILDGLQDPGNMGTIIRTASACGYSDIYLLSCVDAYSPKAVRASMSGIYFVNIHKCEVENLKALLSGFEIIVADFGGKNLFEYTPSGSYAIVIGNEGNGVSDEVKSLADTVLTIPMDSKIESLNASVACALMMYNLKKEF